MTEAAVNRLVQDSLMSPDEQEALSRKYVAPLLLRLSSGNYAVFDQRRQLVGIFAEADWFPMLLRVDYLSANPPVEEKKWSAGKKIAEKAADDILAELGLI